MNAKRGVLRLLRMAAALIPVASLLAAIAPSSAHAQGQYPYPPPGYPPPATYPPPGSYPPPSYPPPRDYPPPERYPQASGRFKRFEPKFTFSLFVGARFGGNIAVNAPNVDYLPISSSPNYGFNLAARMAPHLFAEFMWNRQTTTLSAHDVPTNQIVPLTDGAHLDMYQGSLLYEFWTHSHLRPYAVGGLGFTHFNSLGILSFSDRFSYNLGGGVKYLFAPQIALRAELRWSPSRTTSSSTVFCDPFLGCFTTPITNHAEQWQSNVGLEFRF